ncbi:hypothetical protein BHE74_00003744 [Ensete ventricosum]|nr:hypothetical protein BHE74_00003744 [Ensete ventricosum]
MAVISFARIQEEQLNHEIRRTRVTPRPAMPRPAAPSTTIQAPAPKKLTRDELRERSAELCWHCDEPWSCEHHCKKGRLLVVEPMEDEDNEIYEEALEHKEEAMEEESQLANYAVHALAGYSNPQMMKVGGLLKQQLVNSKVAARLVLQIEGCNKFDVKVKSYDRLLFRAAVCVAVWALELMLMAATCLAEIGYGCGKKH